MNHHQGNLDYGARMLGTLTETVKFVANQ